MENIQKMYIIEFSFNKIAKLQFTVYYRTKNYVTNTFL